MLTKTGVQAGASVVKTSISSAVVTLAPTAPEVGATAVKATATYNGKKVTINQDGWKMTYYIGEVKAGQGHDGASYQATKADLGKKIIFVLTNTQDKYVGSAQAETSPVTIGLKTATIRADTEKLAAGTTLSVTAITDQDKDTKNNAVAVNTTNATYQWYRGSKAITGATGISYTLTAEDESNEAVVYTCKVTGAGNYGGSVDSNPIEKSVGPTQKITKAIIVKGTATTMAETAAVGDTLNIVTTPAAAKDAVTVTWLAQHGDTTDYTVVGNGTSYTVKTGETSVKATVTYVDKDGDAWEASDITQPNAVAIKGKLGAITTVFNNEKTTTKAATYTSQEAEVGLYIHATVANAPVNATTGESKATVRFYSDAACTKPVTLKDNQITAEVYNNTALTDHTIYAKASTGDANYVDSEPVAIKLVPSKSTVKDVVFAQKDKAGKWQTVTKIDPAKEIGIDVVVVDPAKNETKLGLKALNEAGFTVVFASETNTYTVQGTNVAAKTFKSGDEITVTVTPDGVNYSGAAFTKLVSALAE